MKTYLKIITLFVFFICLAFLFNIACKDVSIEEETQTNIKDEIILSENNQTEQISIDQYEDIEFEATAYCPCEKCCGKTDGITATGTKATAGRTIAVDPKVIPYGSEVIIDDNIYIAEDCGGAIGGNRIDIFYNTHEEALAFGRQSVIVKIKKGVISK